MVQLPPNSTGPVLDTVQATVSKERQIASLGDASTGANTATVEALANNTANQAGALVTAHPTTWSVAHTPGAAAQATITKAAGGAGVQHICKSISFALAVDGTNAQTAIQINLRDGATGAGTILWSLTLKKQATEPITVVHITGLDIPGTANTPMTLEFSAAGVTGSVESVSMTGYDKS